MRPRILVTRLLPPQAQQRLVSDTRFELRQWTHDTPMPRAELLRQAQGCAGVLLLLTDAFDAAAADAAGRALRVVSTLSVGFDHVDAAALRQRGVRLGITPDVLTAASAELTVGLLLAAARRFKEGLSIAASSGCWGDWNPTFLVGKQVCGATVGVLGFGRIGQAVARRLKPFEPQAIQYYAPSPKQDAERELGAVRVTDLEAFLSTSDFVVVNCKLTDETRGLLNAEKLAWMKKDSVLVNTARGAIIDHDALYLALKSGDSVGAAGLDVTGMSVKGDPEPFPSNHLLHTLPNCLILPHIGSATMQTREAMADLAISNLFAGVTGQDLPASVC